MAFESLFDVAKALANVPTEDVKVDPPAQTTVPAPAVTPATPPSDAAPTGTSAAATSHPDDNSTTTDSKSSETLPAAGESDGAAADKNPASFAGTAAPDAPPAAVPAPIEGMVDPVFGEETPEQYRSRLTAEATITARIEAEKQLLKRFNVGSVDELNAKLNTPAELTEEQKKRQSDLQRNDIMNFGVKQLGYSPDDFTRAARVETLSDRDLVFEHFQQQWLQNNKNNPLFEGKDLTEEARYEFETLFHLNAENEREKQIGEQSLKLNADQLRAQARDPWQRAEAAHQSHQKVFSDVSDFKKELRHSINTALPRELQFDLPDGAKAKFATDKIDKKGLENYLAKQANFDAYLKGEKKDFQPFLKARIEEYIAIHHYKDMAATVARTAHDVGFKKATPGAKAPFTTTTPQPNTVQPGELTEAERQKIAEVARMR